ncbi:hypothetical protein [Halorubrum sp. CGM4_25_10-8A]|uniref:hypothetical protein n=1 Tax=Halorubrum sp. CGM4_25_10-8A TaxID=2518116 RepID=UPI0010F7A4F5|nr:hypothetical protein [Halorubrum sp. CGM4_25_10-8A]TKX40323.1 hypothetical protein EXE52_06035 [Halorubrum sp. CGM4_25_10-8A]
MANHDILTNRVETAYRAAGYTIDSDRVDQRGPVSFHVSRAGPQIAVLANASNVIKPGVVLKTVGQLTAAAEPVHIATTSAQHAERLRALLECPVVMRTTAGAECYTQPAPFTPDGNERTCTESCVWVATTDEQPAPVEPILSVELPPASDQEADLGDRHQVRDSNEPETQFENDILETGATQSERWNSTIEKGPRYDAWITEHDGRCPPAERPSLLRTAFVPQCSSYEEYTKVMILDGELTLEENRPANIGLKQARSPAVTEPQLDTPDSRPFTAVHLIPRTDWNSIVNSTPN